MKVILLCNEYPPALAGGIGTWTRAYAHALAAEGDQVWVLGLYPLAERVEERDGPVRVLRIPRGSIPKWRVFGDRFRIRLEIDRLNKAHGIDIVEAPDYQGHAAFFRPVCPLVVRLHSLPMRWSDPANAASHPTSWFERRTLQKADLVVAVTKWAGDVARQYYPGLSRLEVVYYTLGQVFLEAPPATIEREAELVMFAGTLTDRKGVWTLAEAWATVKDEFPRAKLVMIGKDWRAPGADQTNAQLLRKELKGLDAQVMEAVGQSELSTWYRRASVACFPSYSETFGLVAAEAMACGTPVVYTTASPGPEVGGHGRAQLVDPGDSKELARAITNVLREPETYQSQALQAARWVHRAALSRGDRCAGQAALSRTDGQGVT